MRCLVLLIIVTLIFITAILTTAKSGEYNFILSFSVIPILSAVFFFSGYEALILFITSLVFASSFLSLGIKIDILAQTLGFLMAVFASAYYMKYLTAGLLNLKERVSEVVKEEYEFSYQLNRKSDDDRFYLEKIVTDISNIYQAPKRMISSSNLEELIESLKKSLEGHFVFTDCKLLLFSFKEKQPLIDRVYDIPEKEKTDTPATFEESLVEIMRSRREPLVIDRSSNLMPPEGLAVSEDVETFMAVNLFSGNRLNGIFAINGVISDDIIRSIILANQFSMVLERIRLYELVQELAITDGLTNMFVRRYFLERAREELERGRHFNAPVSFVMIDIDHFKRCNDKYGHLVGDAVLKDTAAILKKSVREIDLLGRYGGEEFSLLLPETAKKGASLVAERLRKTIETSEITAYDEKIYVTMSMGVASFPDDAEDINQLIDRADQTLYKAKEGGRNRVEVY